jgi:hypothetical protein
MHPLRQVYGGAYLGTYLNICFCCTCVTKHEIGSSAVELEDY